MTEKGKEAPAEVNQSFQQTQDRTCTHKSTVATRGNNPNAH